MFNARRTALYLAIGAMSVAATEAAALTCGAGKTAACFTTGGTRSCFCTGSEICEVIVDSGVVFGVPEGEVNITCGASNYTADGGEGGPQPPFCLTEGFPAGAPTCGTGAASSAPPPAVANPCGSGSDGGIYGTNGVTINGGTVGTVPTASGVPVICSRQTITLTGASTAVYGDVEAAQVKTTAGATLDGSNLSGSGSLLTPSAPATCSPYGPAPVFSGAGGTFNGATGVLMVPTGGIATLNGGSYCFNSISLGSGARFATTADTTVSVNGAIGSSGAEFATDNHLLTINSRGSTVSFSGNGSGANISLFAPNAAFTVTGSGTYSGAFTARTVTLNGAATINNVTAEPGVLGNPPFTTPFDFPTFTARCDVNGICTGGGEISPTSGDPENVCGGTPLLDFTADSFIGFVQVADQSGNIGQTIYAFCTRNGATYNCSEVVPVSNSPDPPECFEPPIF